MKRVRKLELRNNLIGDEGAKILAEAFQTNSSLKRFNLGGNRIGDERAKSLAEALITKFKCSRNY